jgi:hypothetical protein
MSISIASWQEFLAGIVQSFAIAIVMDDKIHPQILHCFP